MPLVSLHSSVRPANYMQSFLTREITESTTKYYRALWCLPVFRKRLPHKMSGTLSCRKFLELRIKVAIIVFGITQDQSAGAGLLLAKSVIKTMTVL